MIFLRVIKRVIENRPLLKKKGLIQRDVLRTVIRFTILNASKLQSGMHFAQPGHTSVLFSAADFLPLIG